MPSVVRSQPMAGKQEAAASSNRTSFKAQKKIVSHTGGSTRAPTEMELKLQLMAVGLQPAAVGCNQRRRGPSSKGRPLSQKKKALSLRARPAQQPAPPELMKMPIPNQQQSGPCFRCIRMGHRGRISAARSWVAPSASHSTSRRRRPFQERCPTLQICPAGSGACQPLHPVPGADSRATD